MAVKNKTQQALQKEYDVAKAEIARLQSRQLRTALHLEVLRQGVTRPDATWFVAGNGEKKR